MFVRGHTVLFFCLSYLDSTIRHKFFTPNCIPLGGGRVGLISSYNRGWWYYDTIRSFNVINSVRIACCSSFDLYANVSEKPNVNISVRSTYTR